MRTTTKEFMEFANGFRAGYVKEWKASGILFQLADHRIDIIGDRERLVSYLRNSLEMEGFRRDDIDTIADWLQEKFK